MRVTKRETIEGLASEVGLAATTTVRQILDLMDDPELPQRFERYEQLQIRNFRILPSVVVTALFEWLKAQQFCPGPPPDYAYRFHVAPDLGALHPNDFRPEFGPVFYRGRLDGTARVLVVGQDPSTDEQLANRTFVGFSGQRLQGLLTKIGLTRSYLIVNTLHLGVKGTFSTNPNLDVISQSPAVRDWRNRLFDHIVATNPIEAIITVGSPARRAVRDLWPGVAAFTTAPSRVVSVWHPAAPEGPALFNSWNNGLGLLTGLVTPDNASLVDATPYGPTWTAGDLVDIPRRDLPFGTPRWHGSGGSTRSQRNGAKQIVWTSP